MGLEIVIPEAVATSVRENTRRFLDSIFDMDPTTGSPRKRPGAASIVAIMERSGAILGAGIAAWFEQHHIEEPILLHLSHMGYELERVCPFWNPLMPWFVEEADYLEAQQTLRALAASDHPFAGQVRKLSQALSRLPAGEHEIRVVDDYVHDGVVSEWILPAAIRIAAEQAGYTPDEIDIRTVSLEEMIQYHFFDEGERVNDFAVTPPDQPGREMTRRRLIYDPYRVITLAAAGRWIDEIVAASFGSNLSVDIINQFNLVMRGTSDYDETPAYAQVAALLPPWHDPRKKVAAFLEAKGVPPSQQDAYLLSLRTRITDKILALTRIP